MNLDTLKKLMIEKGINEQRTKEFADGYKEIEPFKYNDVINDKGFKYKKFFADAYSKYGLYIFYLQKSNEIIYIGEACSEPFSKRLSQHFNESHGGLRVKKKDKITIILDSEILILYDKHSAENKEIHFDEDLLIGVFRPELNDR